MPKIYNIAPIYFCKVCKREMKLKRVITYNAGTDDENKDFVYACQRCKREFWDTIFPNREFSYTRKMINIANAYLTGICPIDIIEGNER